MDAEFLIRCAAEAMVRCYREHAYAEAARLALEFERSGDTNGKIVWCLVIDAIDALTRGESAVSKTVH